MPVIHLIRHAKPVDAGVLLGSTDSPLAHDAAIRAFTAAAAVDAIYSSPLSRARQTADRMFTGREIEVWPELAERHLGDWDGLAWAEVERRWPEEAAQALLDWFGCTPPGSEAWPDFVRRVERAWQRMTGPATIAIVAHAGVNAVLREMAGHSPASTCRQEYGEVITIAIPDTNPLAG